MGKNCTYAPEPPQELEETMDAKGFGAGLPVSLAEMLRVTSYPIYPSPLAPTGVRPAVWPEDSPCPSLPLASFSFTDSPPDLEFHLGSCTEKSRAATGLEKYQQACNNEKQHVEERGLGGLERQIHSR